jgi:2-methylisocitrate lyase-like PEP mutase family enzyme
VANDKLIVRARIDRSLNSIHHFSRGNERFVRITATTQAPLLVDADTGWGSAFNPEAGPLLEQLFANSILQT